MMNTNPKAIKVLCYGDSNTWGYNPITETRYPVNIRWTGVLQELLGEKYWIIEEGLNGRTTNVEDLEVPGRNGLQYLKPCILTHNPIDIIVLMLGTNDTKYQFKRSPEKISDGITDLVDVIKNTAWNKQGQIPHIILLSPPLVDDAHENAKGKFLEAGEKTKRIYHCYERISKKYGLSILNVADWVSPSKTDGVHLESNDHRIIAEKIHGFITRVN